MDENADLKINTDAVRTGASTVNRVGARVAGSASAAPPTVSVPRWATSDAAALASARAATDLTGLGDSVAATARQILAAVLDYEDADARTAGRLRGAR
jgi:hypothetical protein